MIVSVDPSVTPGTIVRINDANVPTQDISVIGSFQIFPPEPTTGVLVGLGLVVLGAVSRRRS
jgi:hypothetical protein